MGVKLMLQGGKAIPDNSTLGDVKSLKSSGMNRVLVIASKEPQSQEGSNAARGQAQKEPQKKPKKNPEDEFGAVEGHIEDAEMRFGVYLSEKESLNVDERKKSLLWFNSVVNSMTKIDGLKLSAREMYDENNRGRMMIKRCSSLLDRVDAEKAILKNDE